MAFNTFSVPTTQSPLQFVLYDGPPEPERPSRRPLSKVPCISEHGNENGLVTTEGGVGTIDLTQMTDDEGDCEINHNGGESGEVGDDGNWGGILVPTSRETAGDEVARQEVACQPLPIEGGSQGTLTTDSSRLEADPDDPYEENASLQPGDRLEVPSTSTTETYDEEVSMGGIDTINSETVDGAKIEASGLLHRRSPSTPPTSPSIMDIQPSTRERRTEKRLEREAKLLTIGSTSSGSSESDADDDDHSDKGTASLIRKRKHFPSANTASHKRRSQGPAWKASTDRVKHTVKRGNPSPSQKKATSSRPSAPRYAPGVQSSGDESSEASDYQTHDIYNLQKGPKSITNNRGNIGDSCTDDEEPLATHAPLHTSRATMPSVNQVSPVKAQWHLSGTTLHSISADMSFLTALFRARSGSGILSVSHAVKLLENVVGLSTKLDDAAIRFLAQDTWVLTSLVGHLPGVAGRGTRLANSQSQQSRLTGLIVLGSQSSQSETLDFYQSISLKPFRLTRLTGFRLIYR